MPVATPGPGSATELARSAARDGAELVLACGGDGTINEVVNGLARSAVPLALLPAGTANIFAHELRLPLDPVRAARTVVRSSPKRLALGRASWRDSAGARRERYFLSIAGVGFDAYIVHRLARASAMRWGVAAYVREALRQAMRYTFPEFTCRLDGSERRATFMVLHRTSIYAGWLHLAPGMDVFSPNLRACLFTSRSRARYFLYALTVLLRSHTHLRDVHLLDVRRAECTTDSSSPVFFEVDGELAGTLPATFEIVPEALTLLLP